MNDSIVIYGFETSNNMKVRIALGYKELAYEFRAIDPSDRSQSVEISGQHLTPVMVHGDRVLFDSAAILRYLDANFGTTPRLFGANRDEQWEIEDWEFFARTELAGPMMEIVHAKVAGRAVDPVRAEVLQAEFLAAMQKLVARLSDREWLVGGSLTAADITAAAVVQRVLAASLFVDSGAGNTFEQSADWRRRVMCYDAHRDLTD